MKTTNLFRVSVFALLLLSVGCSVHTSVSSPREYISTTPVEDVVVLEPDDEFAGDFTMLGQMSVRNREQDYEATVLQARETASKYGANLVKIDSLDLDDVRGYTMWTRLMHMDGEQMDSALARTADSRSLALLNSVDTQSPLVRLAPLPRHMFSIDAGISPFPILFLREDGLDMTFFNTMFDSRYIYRIGRTTGISAGYSYAFGSGLLDKKSELYYRIMLGKWERPDIRLLLDIHYAYAAFSGKIRFGQKWMMDYSLGLGYFRQKVRPDPEVGRYERAEFTYNGVYIPARFGFEWLFSPHIGVGFSGNLYVYVHDTIDINKKGYIYLVPGFGIGPRFYF